MVSKKKIHFSPVMTKGDHKGKIFYPTLTLMMDSYILTYINEAFT